MRSNLARRLSYGLLTLALGAAILAPPATASTTHTGAHKAHAVVPTVPCAQEDETPAFAMRHLQSRLMVAALSCNQSGAYNTFVQQFGPALSNSGDKLVAYYHRTGGGSAALNQQVTDIANAAGRSRADDPNGYCQKTWTVFWELEQTPERLLQIAFDNLVERMSLPPSCPGGRTAGTQEANAPTK